jgi:hypothetical protein
MPKCQRELIRAHCKIIRRSEKARQQGWRGLRPRTRQLALSGVVRLAILSHENRGASPRVDPPSVPRWPNSQRDDGPP